MVRSIYRIPSIFLEHFLFLLVIGTIILAYAAGISNGLVWLDNTEILEGRVIITDWEGFIGIFQHSFSYEGYHRPIYNIIHSIDFWIWGPNPIGYHLSSLVLHITNVSLCYAIARDFRWSRTKSALLCLLWGLHPINTAVVGLVGGKADLFVTTTLLTSFLFLRKSKYGTVKDSIFIICSLMSYFIALLAKEVAYMYPLLITLWFLFHKRACGVTKQEIRWKQIYMYLAWALAIAAMLLRIRTISVTTYHSPLGFVERMATFSCAYLQYILKLIFPYNLSICDTVTRFSATPFIEQVGIMIAVVAIVSIEIYIVYKSPDLRLFVLLFNVFLLPVSQIVPILHFRTDRFLYLPSLAFCGFLIEVWILASRWLAKKDMSQKMFQYCGAVGSVVLALTYVGMVTVRLPDFRDDMTLFSKELERVPDYKEGQFWLAYHYMQQKDYHVAEKIFKECMRCSPDRVSYVDYGAALVNLSFVLLSQGKYEEVCQLAERHRGNIKQGTYRLHLTYNFAVAAYKLERNREAIESFSEYVQKFPNDPHCRYLMGMTLLRLDRLGEAQTAFMKYLELDPNATDHELVERILERLRTSVD